MDILKTSNEVVLSQGCTIFSLENDSLILQTESYPRQYTSKLAKSIITLSKNPRLISDLVSKLTDISHPITTKYAISKLVEDQVLVYSAERSNTDTIFNNENWYELFDIAFVGLAPIEFNFIRYEELDVKKINSVILCSDYLHPNLLNVLEQKLSLGLTCLLVRPGHSTIWVGPILTKGAIPCHNCLFKRLANSRKLFASVNYSLPYNYLIENPKLFNVAMCSANKLYVDNLRDKNIELNSNIYLVEEKIERLNRYFVASFCSCENCGRKDAVTRLEVKQDLLIDLLNETNSDYLKVDLEKLKKIERICNPLTGVLSNSTSGDLKISGIYTTSITVPTFHDINLMNNNNKLIFINCSGKGVSDEMAYLSGVCEGIERYSMLYQGYEAQILESYSTIEKDAIHPNDIMLFSKKQYEINKVISKKNSFRAPMVFDNEEKIYWTKTWSILDNTFKYVPTSLLFFNTPFDDTKYFISDSSGTASGTSFSEAYLTACLECVERDAVGIWWYNKIKRPSIELSSLKNYYINNLVKYYSEIGCKIWVLDITTDIEIPSYVACAKNIKNESPLIIFGFGCHFDKEIAVLHSVTELNQKIALLAKTYDYITASDPLYLMWNTIDKHNDINFLYPDDNISIDDKKFDLMYGSDILRFLNNRFANLNLTPYLIDISRDETNLFSCKVIIPEMRSMWPRLREGRLYDVPAKLGWKERPLIEDEMNNIYLSM